MLLYFVPIISGWNFPTTRSTPTRGHRATKSKAKEKNMPPIRPYAHMTEEELIRTRDNPNNKGCQPQTDAIIELEQRKLQADIQQVRADVKKLTIPHWTRKWTFYLVVAALAISIAALALQWRADIRDSKYSRVSSPASAPSTTTTPNSSPISTQKKPISQRKHAPMKP